MKKTGSTLISRYDYGVNSLGQRTSREQSGTAFAATATELFGYNAKGEVISTSHSGQSARNQGFAYDQIGNRLAFTRQAGTTSYTSNGLNQYTQITGFNSAPTYDFDGNQTSSGLGQLYAWDAENRLVTVEPVLPVNGDKKVLNTYDYQSRRVRRQVFTWAGATWQPSQDEKFIYEDWNVVAVLDATASAPADLRKAYTWGLDLSRTRQGAGGVGGLLAVTEYSAGTAGASYHYAYDANGNVGQLVGAGGALAAHYEYDAFGNTVFATGAYAETNEYRFSTKPLDGVSGLYYYGFRYYNPSTGRWSNRDPIGENGGVNLYGMVGNSPLNYVDVDGRWAWPLVVGGVGGAVALGGGAVWYLGAKFQGEWIVKISNRDVNQHMLDNYPGYDPSKHGLDVEHSLADALQHCVGSCRLYKKASLCPRRKLDDKLTDYEDAGTPEGRMDLHNNAVGKAIADSIPDDAANIDSACMENCQKAARAGQLRRYNPDTGELYPTTGRL